MEKNQIIGLLEKARYAHRGFHKKPEIPENSMYAFRLAVEEGFGIELDVHLTADNNLAVIHDSSLKRTCGIDLIVEDITLERAQNFILEKSENERIPDFEEVLKLVDGRIPLVIELKTSGGNYAQLCKRMMEALEGYKGLYCIESFDPLVVKWLRENRPDIVRGQLAGGLRKSGDVNIKKSQDFLLRNLLVNLVGKPDFVAYKYSDIEAAAFRRFKGAKFTWTVKDYDDMKRAESMGVAVIFEQFNPKDYEM